MTHYNFRFGTYITLKRYDIQFSLPRHFNGISKINYSFCVPSNKLYTGIIADKKSIHRKSHID